MKLPAFVRIESTMDAVEAGPRLRYEAVLASPERWRTCQEAADPLGGWSVTYLGPLLLAIRFFDEESGELVAIEDVRRPGRPWACTLGGAFSTN